MLIRCFELSSIRLRTSYFWLSKKRLPDSIMAIIANFDKQSSSYHFPCEGGLYFKILDSADINWLGPGSGLPKNANLGDEHKICPLSLSVFINKKEKK